MALSRNEDPADREFPSHGQGSEIYLALEWLKTSPEHHR
jgi:hypothetical protein